MMKVDSNHFITYINVAVSEQFFAWVIGIGQGAKVVGPENVVEMMKDEARRLMKQYL